MQIIKIDQKVLLECKDFIVSALIGFEIPRNDVYII